MEPTEKKSRGQVVAAAVLGTALILAVGFVWLRSPHHGDESAPRLNPNDSMQYWRNAGPQQKLATARAILTELRSEGMLGPRTVSAANSEGGIESLAKELVEALDAAADPDNSAYVSPGESMGQTARKFAAERGWHQ